MELSGQQNRLVFCEIGRSEAARLVPAPDDGQTASAFALVVDPTWALVNIEEMSLSEHLSAASTFRRVWKVSHALPEMDRMALFDAERSELVVLNALGREVWQGLDGVRTVRELAEALRGEAEGAPDQDQAEREVLRFLSDLHGRGAVELLEQRDGASPPLR